MVNQLVSDHFLRVQALDGQEPGSELYYINPQGELIRSQTAGSTIRYR